MQSFKDKLNRQSTDNNPIAFDVSQSQQSTYRDLQDSEYPDYGEDDSVRKYIET